MNGSTLQPDVKIRDVWADSLEDEMAIIRDLVENYPYIAMVRLDPPSSACLDLCDVSPRRVAARSRVPSISSRLHAA